MAETVHWHLCRKVAGLWGEVVCLWHDVATAADLLKNALPSLNQAVERLGVVLHVINDDALITLDAYLVLRVRQILSRQPPIDRVLCDFLDRERRVFVFVTTKALDHRLA